MARIAPKQHFNHKTNGFPNMAQTPTIAFAKPGKQPSGVLFILSSDDGKQAAA